MLTVFPEDYPRFRCRAGRCAHTCCAGWEIDIDPETRETYRGIPGALGARLSAAIDDSADPARFRLGEGERCPFLNDDNLCDLILSGGESLLCQICRDHPRFRTFLPGRTEVGLGLCCEAAAEQLLGRKEPFRLVSEGAEDQEGEAAALLALREELFALARDRSLPLPERMDRILARCGAALPERSLCDWAEYYLGLERLDERWTHVLTQLRDRAVKVDIIFFRQFMTERETEYEQLLAYFLYRHFLKAYDDGDVTGKAAFAVLSVRLLEALGALHWKERGSFSREDQIEYVRMYSAEIEYSEENLDTLFDELYRGDGET